MLVVVLPTRKPIHVPRNVSKIAWHSYDGKKLSIFGSAGETIVALVVGKLSSVPHRLILEVDRLVQYTLFVVGRCG